MPDLFIDKDHDGKNDLIITDPTEKKQLVQLEAVVDGVGSKIHVLHDTTPHPMGMLSSFTYHPLEFSFESQDETEEVHLFLRQHFTVNITWIALSLLLIILPIVALPVLSSFAPIVPISPTLGTIFLVFYVVAIFGFALTNFIHWYFNIYIVTNQRVVDIDFYNLLNRQISSARLDDIRDVTAHSAGLAQNYFDFGDILIQTEATLENIEFENVPHPNQVTIEIEKLIDEKRKSEGGGN